MCKTDVYKAKCPKCKGAWQVKETVHPMCKEAAKAKPPQRGQCKIGDVVYKRYHPDTMCSPCQAKG